MQTIIAAIVFCAGIALPGIVLGQEQPQCIPTPAMMEILKDGGYSPIWVGLDDRGIITSIFETADHRWMLTISNVEGITCEIAVGGNSQITEPAPVGLET